MKKAVLFVLIMIFSSDVAVQAHIFRHRRCRNGVCAAQKTNYCALGGCKK